MSERIDNLDSIEDFGFGRNNQQKPDALSKQIDFRDLADEPSSSEAFTLASLMSGSVYTATTSALPTSSASTQLSLNYETAQNLAFFGSVYTRVTIALQRVAEEYPNGIIIAQIITGTP